MFNQQELQILIGGTEEPVNIDDLRANTVYGGAFHDGHDTVETFWKVRTTLSPVI
jgi:ubiquitin-protein ligase E3 C